MPAYSKQLEDKDGNILYPITTAGSVVDEDGVDLQTRVEDAAYIGTGSVGTLSPWVDTSDIVDEAVTTAKIDDGAVTTGKIADGAVTHAKLAEEAAIGRPIELFHGNNVDLNTMTESGIHRFYTPYTNGPSGTYTYCTMLVMNYSDDYRCSQYFTGIDDNGSGVIAVRFSFFYMGTTRAWSSWKIIAQWPD